MLGTPWPDSLKLPNSWGYVHTLVEDSFSFSLLRAVIFCSMLATTTVPIPAQEEVITCAASCGLNTATAAQNFLQIHAIKRLKGAGGDYS